MEFVNVFDEERRFVRLESHKDGQSGQINSDGFSYLYMRECFKEIGQTMGLERQFPYTIDKYE